MLEGAEKILASIGEKITDIFPTLFYWIWRGLAAIVNLIEGIFRNLAGLNGGDNNDMVSSIINNGSVKAIFGNLVGLSMALIVFFTIVKILQDHYKDKEGGNPYKIVLRTFKGLLMFFFINAAVTVGLMATRTMFKALDAATGGGQSSGISGQVFKAMVAGDPGASRKRIGLVDDEEFGAVLWNEYYNRMAPNPDGKDGIYVVVDMTNSKDTPKDQAQLKARYQELFPDTQYGVVAADGKTLIPLSQWSNTYYEDAMNEIANEYLQGDGWYGYQSGDDGFYATAGYQNDILRHVSTTIKPSIDLTWSPIDIYNYGYSLYETEVNKHDIDTTVMGTGSVIPMSTTFVRFGDPIVTMKSLEESAKQFGISINGKVSLQGGEVSAKFDLEHFEGQFQDILFTVLTNVLYTNLTQMIIQAIPQFPASTSIYTFKFNYLQLLAPVLMKLMKASNDTFMNSLGLIPKDANGKPLAETFVVGPSKHNGGIWVAVNDKSKYLPITIEKYQIDANFTDLWSQLVESYNEFIEQAEKAQTETWKAYESDIAAFQNLSGRLLEEQKEWVIYKGLVDEYNIKASGYLNELGNQLSLYDMILAKWPNFDETRDDPTVYEQVSNFLTEQGFAGSVDALEESIKTKFVDLVSRYIDASHLYKNTKPGSSFADPRAIPAIYKPVVEFFMTKNYAEELSVKEIIDTFFNQNKNYVKVNMYIDDFSNNKAAYRMLDWENTYSGVTGPYYSKFSSYTDFYMPHDDYSYDEENQNNPIVKHNSLNELVYLSIPKQSESWKNQGLNYFINKAVNGNPFYAQTAAGGCTSVFHSNAYWGDGGITMDGVRYFQEYRGTGYTDDSGMNHGFGTLSTQSLLPTENINKVYTSSANINAFMNASRNSMSSQLSSMAAVDTTTPLAQEFAKNIITFRRLDANKDGVQDKDINALKSWVDQGVKAAPASNDYQALRLSDLTAGQIDDLMVSSASPRRYLMLTEKNTNSIGNNGENFKQYIGVFSYTDITTVKHIYHKGDINFIIGFIAIIAASGVYLNFAFGLIQRAINMTVLYVMSPIAISFYPFDDGSRFSSQFVTPFYKEAISAFAVIASLNLFIVLLGPVETSIKTVTGSTVLGWLGLVAFVSMLPQIRSKVESILGSGSLAEKSLGAAFSDAKKTLGKDISGIGKGAKKFAGGVAKTGQFFRGVGDAIGLNSEDRQKSKLAKLEAKKKKLQAQGKDLGYWGSKKYDKLKGIDSQQERINAAISKGEDGINALSKNDRRRYDKQAKAAERAARKNVDKKSFGGNTKAYEAELNAEKARLLNDDSFKKSVGAVAAMKKGKRAIGGALKNAGSKIANSRAFGEGSLLGETARAVFGEDGTLSKKSALYKEIQNWRNPAVRKKGRSEIAEKRRSRVQEKLAFKEDGYAALRVLGDNTAKADNKYVNVAKRDLAYDDIKKADNRNKLKALMAQQYIQDGLSKEEALKKAGAEIGAMNQDQFDVNIKKFGGVSAINAKLADGVSRNLAEFRGLGFDIDFQDAENRKRLSEYEASIREKSKGGSKAVQEKIKAEQANLSARFGETATQMYKAMGKDASTNEGKEAIKKIQNILAKSNPGTSYAEIASQISDATGISVERAKEAFTAYSNNFNDEHLATQLEIQDLQDAMGACKLIEKGEETFVGKVGPNISSDDKAEVIRAFANYGDANYDSINPESLGYALNQIKIKYENNGGLSNPQCQAEMNQKRIEMSAALDRKMSVFCDTYADTIRVHASAKKYGEERSATPTMVIATEAQQQREFYVGTQMETPAHNLYLTDAKTQDMHDGADYAGAAVLWQETINKVKQHDFDEAYAVGLDEKTVEKMIQWEQNGQSKYLDQIHGLAELDIAHMGSPTVGMGGESLMGMQTALAQTYAVIENEKRIEKAKVKLNDLARNESGARDAVKRFRAQIDSLFSIDKFNEIYIQNKVTDIHGHQITSTAEFTKALDEVLAAVESDELNINSNEVSSIMQAMNDFRNAKIGTPGFESIIESAAAFNDMVAQAGNANKFSAETDATNAQINDLNSKIQEQLKKLKYLGGGKKG